MARRQQLDAIYPGSVGEIFRALCRTLSFRRWASASDASLEMVPGPGSRYRSEFGSIARAGHVVEVIRPVAITLKESIQDGPCRVSLTMRWRIDPGLAGCTVRLRAHYDLNQPAMLRARHWEQRMRHNFLNQFAFLAVHLERMQTGQKT